jgi:hypothetical protein
MNSLRIDIIGSRSCSSVLIGMLMLKGYSLCACSFILIGSLHFKGVARNMSRCVVVTVGRIEFVILVVLPSPSQFTCFRRRLQYCMPLGR